MPAALKLQGLKFGKLTVFRRVGGITKQGAIRWLCRCDCGKFVKIIASHLTIGNSTNCGCVRKEKIGKLNLTHGLTVNKARPGVLRTYTNMMQRCYNKNNTSYHNYGGRGITVCARWRNNFENFFADMGNRPAGKSIDRIRNNGNYTPKNCHWATTQEQNKNKKR